MMLGMHPTRLALPFKLFYSKIQIHCYYFDLVDDRYSSSPGKFT